MAISAATQVISYRELPEDEVPPENIWHHPEQIEEWFEAVKIRRRDGLQRTDDDPGDFTQNELTRGWRDQA